MARWSDRWCDCWKDQLIDHRKERSNDLRNDRTDTWKGDWSPPPTPSREDSPRISDSLPAIERESVAGASDAGPIMVHYGYQNKKTVRWPDKEMIKRPAENNLQDERYPAKSANMFGWGEGRKEPPWNPKKKDWPGNPGNIPTSVDNRAARKDLDWSPVPVHSEWPREDEFEGSSVTKSSKERREVMWWQHDDDGW